MTAVLVACVQRFSMQPGALFGKAAENDVCDSPRGGQRVDHRIHSNPGGAIGREAVDAGGDGGKGKRCEAVCLAQLHGPAITRRERLVFACATALPDRPDGMNHVPRRQSVALGDLGVAGLATAKRAAFGE